MSGNNNKEIRQIIGENSGKGEIRVECPNPHCEGSQKNTLCISTESGLYHCHRCGMKGNALTGGSHSGNGDKTAQEKAIGMLGNSFPADTFPYLGEKQVRAYEGVREYHFRDGERVLLIPVTNSDGEILSVQIISENGEKKFLKGTPKKGNFYKINGNGIIFICEGYATGASLADATGGTVYVAFDSGNILPVLEKIVTAHDEIVICADNDHKTKENPGMTKAMEAASKYDNVKVACPEGIVGTDFNDMMIEKGAEAITESIARAKRPGKKAMPPETEKPGKRPAAALLTDIGLESDLFPSGGKGYVTILTDGHYETLPLESSEYKNHLRRIFFTRYGIPCNDNALKTACGTLCAFAMKNEEKPACCRIGRHGGAIYVDLCNDKWEAVRITEAGWEIVRDPEVRFVRHPGMLPLPYPVRSSAAGLEDLKRFANLKEESDYQLMIGWLIGAYSPEGPYPLLVLQGEEGTAKSMTIRILRDLIDPNRVPLRSPAKDERDLMISASHSHVLSFDNMSSVSARMSDCLCRIATGGGLSTRRLYTDGEEEIFEAKNPVILAGIDDIVSRHDLGDRCIVINSDYISPKKRKTERQLMAEFGEVRPGILAEIFDAVSAAIGNMGNTSMEELPRMADFAIWVKSAEAALPWNENEFLEAYLGNRKEVIRGSVGANLVENQILSLLNARADGTWKGTATELLDVLNEMMPEHIGNGKEWPRTANKLSGEINRISRSLRENGIGIDRRRSGQKRIIILSLSPDSESTDSVTLSSENQTERKITDCDNSDTLSLSPDPSSSASEKNTKEQIAEDNDTGPSDSETNQRNNGIYSYEEKDKPADSNDQCFSCKNFVPECSCCEKYKCAYKIAYDQCHGTDFSPDSGAPAGLPCPTSRNIGFPYPTPWK